MQFKYTAKDSKGKKVVGYMSATDKAAVLSALKNDGFFPLGIAVEEDLKKGEPKEKGRLRDIQILEKDIHEVKIKKKKMLALLRQFSIMMRAGVSLSMALTVLVEQEKQRQLRKILEEIREDMYAGRTLSSSMMKFKTFSEVTVNIVTAGEENGRLDQAFQRAGDILEREIELLGKVRGALTYPAFLLVLTLAVVAILNVVVLPMFTTMFESSGAELPILTKIVMGTSSFITGYWYGILASIFLVIGIFIYVIRHSKGFRLKIDAFVLHVPLIGTLMMKLYIARFCRTMSTLVDAGVEIVHSLTVSTEVIPNTYLKVFFNAVLDDVRVGVPINRAMSRHKAFDPLLVSMIRVGEESGMLFDVLEKMAEMYEEQTDEQSKILTSLMEPMITVIIGLVVGTVVVSIVIPMFEMYDFVG